MRAIWKGAVSFGLVNVPVRVFGATEEHDIRFHQVHRVDGGRIRMKRVCAVCGEDVTYDQLAKGYESADGRAVILTDDDFAGLPLSTSRMINVLEFVPTDQIDPILFDRTYYLEPEARAARPYLLLREALQATDRMAVARVALRQRETLAVLRVREQVIMMQTLLWPDEIRTADFEVLDTGVEVRPQELAMAESLVQSLSTNFTPAAYEDQYAKAVASLVEAKLEGATPAPVPAAEATGDEALDLLTTLQASVERARTAREEATTGTTETAPAARGRAAKSPATKSPATKAPATKAPATETPAAKQTATKHSSEKDSPEKKRAAKKTAPRPSA